MIQTLTDQMGKLKSTNTGLNNKIQLLTEELEKRKKEITNLKKSALRKANQNVKNEGVKMELEVLPGRHSRTISPEPAIVKTNTLVRSQAPLPAPGPQDSTNWMDLAKRYKVQ
jgi:hypothetical protein